MKLRFLSTLLLMALSLQPLHADPLGTAFTYQGKLSASGTPVSGTYDFLFLLYTNATSGTQIGSTLSVIGVPVADGMFTTALDFGAQVPFNGTAYWLAIWLRTNGVTAFTPMLPRQPLMATPNAVFALSAGVAGTASNVVNGSVTAAAIAPASITAANIGSSQVVKSINGLQDAVTLAPGNNVSLTPSGNSITIAASAGPAGWSLTGNAATTPAVNFLGTTDNQPLELWVNGARALRLEPGGFYPPNVLAGPVGNTADIGALGAVVGGGEKNRMLSSVYDSVIAGGSGNTNTGSWNVIGGGFQNSIQYFCQYASIAGGGHNAIDGSCDDSTIGGGVGNHIFSGATEATIPGGRGNTVTGPSGFAAGAAASAGSYSFVWADGTSTVSTAAKQFIVRAAGGVTFYSSDANNTAGLALSANGSAWTSPSDRNEKKNLQPLDRMAVLEKLQQIPISCWNYRWEQDEATPNIGPMAQDFKVAFYPGRDTKTISTLEFDGVELAAIQALNQKLIEKDAQISELRHRLEKLERLFESSAQTMSQAGTRAPANN